MTAQEVMARVNNANALVGSMLQLAYTLQIPQYVEIARRFCIKDSTDKDVKKFRENCLKEGVPEEMLDVDRWDIEPERVLGAGNKTLEMAQADRLMAVRNLLDPEAAREVLHVYVETNTDDAQMAERLVPMTKKQTSDSTHDAQIVAGTLLMGLPVAMKSGINHIEYAEALMTSMAAVLKRVQAEGDSTEMKEVAGLMNLGQHIEQHIGIIAQDKGEAQRVKKYSDALGKMMNLVKALQQRAMEKMQSQNGQAQITPEAQSKIMSSQIMAQSSAKIKEQSAAQKRSHKERDFLANQARKDVQTQADLHRQADQANLEVQTKDVLTAAEIQAQQLKAKNESPTQE